ncbi:polyamine aminopropyltransferase [Clostridium sp. 'deep sea']|uniref:polyamine aminopropyltransferase n=1 Tax=Clostridium sp. 'deep sea' TaxID=2779445 RepID=UPI0018969EEB|nr:polyamine aminopropyltransferase [Clostridium sp. 'deep sea']QOR35541.1 polyamine aminopropyltransferase [Clostridium sp. 'deep sea']
MAIIKENYEHDVSFTISAKCHLHSERSEFQKIDFYDTETFGVVFTLDDLIMVTEKDEFIYHDMICHPSFAINPKIKKVLIIGGGDGGTAREVLRYPVEQVDMVEIDERVVLLCEKYLPQTAYKLKDKRLTLHYKDGIKFVKQAANNSYDLILVDSTDPIGPGEGLFSYDFYQNCYRCLNKNGILINQHESPYYSKDCHEMLRAQKKLKQTFEVSQIYQFHMPTYPSGHWLFGFASKGLNPVKPLKAQEWLNFNLYTKYYNVDLHRASFMLPTYVKELLKNND